MERFTQFIQLKTIEDIHKLEILMCSIFEMGFDEFYQNFMSFMQYDEMDNPIYPSEYPNEYSDIDTWDEYEQAVARHYNMGTFEFGTYMIWYEDSFDRGGDVGIRMLIKVQDAVSMPQLLESYNNVQAVIQDLHDVVLDPDDKWAKHKRDLDYFPAHENRKEVLEMF